MKCPYDGYAMEFLASFTGSPAYWCPGCEKSFEEDSPELGPPEAPQNSSNEAKTPLANVSDSKDNLLKCPDTVDLEAGRYNGLHEAAEHLRELARNYALRAARISGDGSDVALGIAEEHRAKAALLRECADEFDSRVPRAGLPLSPFPISQAGASASAQTQDVTDKGSVQHKFQSMNGTDSCWHCDRRIGDPIHAESIVSPESESSISSTEAIEVNDLEVK